VVKKGSKIFFRVDSSIPGPLSSTSTTATPPMRRTCRAMTGARSPRALPAKAWAALVSRLSTTCSISVAEQGTGGMSC